MRHAAMIVAFGAGAVLTTLPVAPAWADDDPVIQPDQPELVQHNITYHARVDGLARGALVSYRISDTQVNTADPTMLPGRIFETTAVLTDPNEAGMRISIQWPYSANLVCEILVDDQIVAAASQFISPRLTPAREDPDYGALNCGAPLTNATGEPLPAEPAPPVPGDPAEPAPPVPGDPAVPLPGTAVDPLEPPVN